MDYDFSRPPGRISRFLWFCAGVDEQLLRRCPRGEWAKYEGIGGVVFATTVLAFISGSYAFYTVFAPKQDTALAGAQQVLHSPSVAIAITAGLVWCLVIFNLDRFVVSSGGKGDGTEALTLQELGGAMPRLAMAIMIGITLAKPLEIRIMESEIEAQLELEQQSYVAELNDKATKLVEEKKTELVERIENSQGRLDERRDYFEGRRKEIVAQRRQLELEAEGLTGSGKAGRGPAWRDKKDTLDALESELSADRLHNTSRSATTEGDVTRWKSDLESLNSALDEQKAANARQGNNLDGLMKRIQIAEEISPIGSLMLMLLLLSIEVAPILFKLMLAKGPYDYLEQNLKQLVAAQAGVQLEAIEVREKGGKVVLKERYLQYQAAIQREERRLSVEKELSEVALEAFRQRTLKAIAEDLDAFIEKA
jgi:hypothetical protein